MLALLGLTALLVCDFILGSLDWDLMALVSFPLTFLLAYRVSILPDNIVKRVAVPAVVIGLISMTSWVYINHTDASIARLEDIVSNEPASYFRTHSGPLRVALALRGEGRNDLAIEVLGREVERNPADIDVLSNLAGFQYEAGNYEKTIPAARTFLGRIPWNVYAYRMLLKSYIRLGRQESAQTLAREHSEQLIAHGTREWEAGRAETAALAWGARYSWTYRIRQR